MRKTQRSNITQEVKKIRDKNDILPTLTLCLNHLTKNKTIFKEKKILTFKAIYLIYLNANNGFDSFENRHSYHLWNFCTTSIHSIHAQLKSFAITTYYSKKKNFQTKSALVLKKKKNIHLDKPVIEPELKQNGNKIKNQVNEICSIS